MTLRLGSSNLQFGVAIYALFVGAAYRYSSYWLVVGWMLHPVWDLGVHWFGPGREVVDEWYAIACFSFDLFAAGYLFYLTRNSARFAAT